MEFKFDPEIMVNIWEIKVLEHADPLFLIGADILYRGSWGQNTCLNSIWALGASHGEVEFTVEPSTKTITLHWAPFKKGQKEVALDC